MDAWMRRWLDAWMDGWNDRSAFGWMDVWMDESVMSCTFSLVRPNLQTRTTLMTLGCASLTPELFPSKPLN